MPTMIKSLGIEEMEYIKGLFTPRFLHGGCYALAIAFHRGLSWGMIALQGQGDLFPHVGSIDQHGNIWDARGKVTKDEFVAPFGGHATNSLMVVHEKDLIALSGPHIEDEIETAGTMTRFIWPDLPWQSGDLHTRVVAFMEELEKLCRKHKFWIRAPVPTQRPIISALVGDEAGFVIEPDMTGSNFFFDRRLMLRDKSKK